MILLRLSLRSIAGARERFALTVLATAVGVAFTVGVLIATESIRAALGQVAEGLHENVDITVRSKSDLGDLGQDVPLLEAGVKDQLEAIDGIEKTSGVVAEFNVVAIDAEGTALDPGLGPQIGEGWPEDESLGSIFVLDDGVSRRPVGPDEFAMDYYTADDHGFRVGERYQVSTPSGTRSFELVGFFYFLEPDLRLALQQVAWDIPTARQLLHGGGGYDYINVALSPGASLQAVTASVQRALGSSVEVLSRQEQTAKSDEEFGRVMDSLRNMLLAFAIVVLVISAFISYSMFQLLTGRRSKQLALLRVLGADRRHVAQMVAVEALLVGGAATVAGYGLGVLVSRAILGALRIAGGHLPSIDATFDGGAVLAAFVVGFGVTVISAVWPAVRACRVVPMTVLANDPKVDPGSQRRSIIMGSVFGGAGLVLVVVGVLSDLPTLRLLMALGVGALAVLTGVRIASPAVAAPISLLVGWTVGSSYTISGRLARLNAARNPRRTAVNASALMIGLAMVSLVAVVGTSFKQTAVKQLEESLRADWMICVDDCGNVESVFSSQAAREIAALPQLESVHAFRLRHDAVRSRDGAQHTLTAAGLASLARHIDPGIVSGSLSEAGPGDVMVHVDVADRLGLAAGDRVSLEFAGRRDTTFNVVAVFSDDSVMSSWVIDVGDWDRLIVGDQVSLVSAITATGVSLHEARAALEAELVDYPQLSVRNQVEFRQSRAAQIDTVLAITNVFSAVAAVIALLGISNTMALSVYERTRELGLLRAVGMDNRQIGGAIALESVIVAVFGGLVGIVTGVGIGLIVAVALPSDIISAPSVPVLTLIVYVVMSAMVGLLAAIFPAHRANRLDVLKAISPQL